LTSRISLSESVDTAAKMLDTSRQEGVAMTKQEAKTIGKIRLEPVKSDSLEHEISAIRSGVVLVDDILPTSAERDLVQYMVAAYNYCVENGVEL
jgi:hypothetical protein